MIVEASSPIYSIAELNSKARLLLETQLGTVWITGELSNLAAPSSGHLYFTLKDAEAQVRCAFFRPHRTRMAFAPENGQQIIAKAHVSLYEARGDYQLIITDMQLAGNGALQIAFDKLKHKLQHERLFDTARKKPIPTFVQTIGVITSPSGAAIHDILKVLRHRNPSIAVIIYPSMVQGNEAKIQLAQAIELANNRAECDVLILARGGGSLEDLWPFNEETVARAIAASHIPIVTGVGHEVNITIADFVADHRAPTPSAAAEYVSINQNDIRQKLAYFDKYLNRYMHHLTQTYHHRITQLKTRLRHPGDRLREQAQGLDQLEQQLVFYIQNTLTRAHTQWVALKNSLNQCNPAHSIKHSQNQLTQLTTTLLYHMQTQRTKKQEQLALLAHQLHALSPLNTLQRGYSIITNKKNELITSVHAVKKSDKLQLRFTDGSVDCIIT